VAGRNEANPRRRSGRFVKFDRNAGGGNALQRGAADVGAIDAVDLEIKADNRVGVIFFRFVDQRPDGRQAIGLGGRGADGAPTGARIDAADRMMAAAAFELMGATDLHGLHRLFVAPAG
jgi:hypothetical protein